MKELGGYFEIEFSNIDLSGIHPGAIRLNTARNCFEYILLARAYKKVFVPYYTCDVVLEPLVRHGISYEFYHVESRLEPEEIPDCREGEAFLYTNYFGIKGSFINGLAGQHPGLIIDNSQALFEPAFPGLDTFYSLRKFVGVPDGAFLYCEAPSPAEPAASSSADRVSHLYRRKDEGADSGYADFKSNDAALSGLPLAAMSRSTACFLKTYDFQKNKLARERNFLLLHQYLGAANGLLIENLPDINGPLCYPFLPLEGGLKELLIRNKIFVPTFWPNTFIPSNLNDAEQSFQRDLCCLPVSADLTSADIKFILKTINTHTNGV